MNKIRISDLIVNVYEKEIIPLRSRAFFSPFIPNLNISSVIVPINLFHSVRNFPQGYEQNENDLGFGETEL